MESTPYSRTAVILHWTIALLIVGNIALILWIHEMPREQRGAFMGVHKSIGLTVLLLSLVRVGYRLTHPWPALPATMPGWEKLVARATHVLFYVAILVIPLLGWAAASSRPGSTATPFYGLFPWPDLPLSESREQAGALGDVHGLVAWSAVVLVVLHVAGAIWNTYFKRRGVLARMLPGIPTPRPETPSQQ